MKVEAALLSNRLKGKAVPPYNQIPVLWTPCGVHVWVCELQVSGFGEGRAPGTQHQLLAASVPKLGQEPGLAGFRGLPKPLSPWLSGSYCFRWENATRPPDPSPKSVPVLRWWWRMAGGCESHVSVPISSLRGHI